MRHGMKALAFVASLGLLVSACGGGDGGGGEPSNKAPVASFTASPPSGPAPLQVNVDARQSTDPDGSIASYDWIFGDGQSATGPIASHVYTRSGTYQIQLTVRDNQGAGSTAASTVSVTATPPVAAFNAVPNSGVAPLLVSFDASASSDADGSIVSYSWAFGDSATGSGQTVTHTYGIAPTFWSSDYAVVLTVRDNDGLEASVTHSVTVTAAPVALPKQFAYVANSRDGTVSTYAIDATTGALTNVGSPVDAGPTPNFVAVHPSNRFVYATVADGDRVWAFAIDAATGVLSRIGVTETIVGARSIAFGGGSKFAYVPCSGSSICTYSIDATTGALTRLGLPVGVGEEIEIRYIAADPTGSSVYVLARGAVYTYAVNATTGELTRVGAPVGTGIEPVSMAIEPAGRFVYVMNLFGPSISAYSRDASTGVLSAGDVTSAPSVVEFMAIDPAGKFAYVTGGDDSIGYIFTYGINATTGALTESGSISTGGSRPSAIVIDVTGRFLLQTSRTTSSPGYIRTYSINSDGGDLTFVSETSPAGRGQASIARTN